MTIEPFNIANIDIVAAMLDKMWKKDIFNGIEHSFELSREVVLNLFFDPQLALQACDENGEMQALALARMKNDVNTSKQWIEDFLVDKDDNERKKVLEAISYLLRTERVMLNLMCEDSAKFSFLISYKRGYAKALQERLMKMLTDRGVRWTYHITDSTCSWQYFDEHGFERVHEELIERFSTPTKPYYCYMYRKCIQ
ncbi:MAG: hypothetical protein IJR20_03500 [Muribaculaceae bacterium]|nr:hypothetical protein [Muribaculaceae bacterium]